VDLPILTEFTNLNEAILDQSVTAPCAGLGCGKHCQGDFQDSATIPNPGSMKTTCQQIQDTLFSANE
jgi:hypothetical protein